MGHLASTFLDRSVLGVDEGTRKREMAAQVQQASAMVDELRATAHNLSRDVKTAEATLRQVWLLAYSFYLIVLSAAALLLLQAILSCLLFLGCCCDSSTFAFYYW